MQKRISTCSNMKPYNYWISQENFKSITNGNVRIMSWKAIQNIIVCKFFFGLWIRSFVHTLCMNLNIVFTNLDYFASIKKNRQFRRWILAELRWHGLFCIQLCNFYFETAILSWAIDHIFTERIAVRKIIRITKLCYLGGEGKTIISWYR